MIVGMNETSFNMLPYTPYVGPTGCYTEIFSKGHILNVDVMTPFIFTKLI